MDQNIRTIFGSDVQRDGVYLELGESSEGSWSPFLEVFRSDQDGSITVTFYTDEGYELPFSILEEFVHRARRELADRALTRIVHRVVRPNKRKQLAVASVLRNVR